MISSKTILYITIFSGLSLLISCESEGDRRGSKNDPEIVSRTADTVFNQVPGQGHYGIDTYAEAGESGNLLRTMSEAGSFNNFAEAVHKAGLAEVLTNEEPYTVFAPTDQAFSKLPQENIKEIFNPENKQKLIDLVNSHIVRGSINHDELSDGSTLTTLNGNTINVKMVDGRPTINNFPITEQDENPENGALYALDDVLMPLR
ncbi:MAG: fasciclin domain-containing protein [Bacteroidota bacterium]|jgi:uncharacterized surface protein with fasciclin (FAS1) repeats|nr:fasciclin domain-containing protein [Bacteroidota bacterium]